MIPFGAVPIGAVLPVFFDAFAGSTGASITISGLAVTDIEIFKGTSMTQRASDAGYVLMDTDGIDLDGITGIHGFSIDTGDNTDAGFYAAGSFYTVVVSAVTVDSQTVNFVAATFRCVAAENTAGIPVADTVRVAGTAQTAGDIIGDTNDIQSRLPAALTAGGNIKADSLAISGDTTAADNAESFFDGTGYAGTNNVIPNVTLVGTLTTYTGNTPQTGDSFARIGALGAGLTAVGDTAGTTTLLSRLSAARAGYLDNLSAGAVALASGVNVAQWLGSTPNALISGRLDVNLQAGATGVVSASLLAADAANEIADALLDRADAIETGETPRMAWRHALAALAGVLSGAATTTVVIKGAGVATTRITATVDADGNRSAVVLA